MRIYKTFKPTRVINAPVDKQTLMRTILEDTYPYTHNKHVKGNVIYIDGVKHVRAFNLVKHNRKVVRLRGDNFKENGMKHVLKPLYWEAFIYDIPYSILEYLNLHLVQHKRHFEIVEL